MTKLHSRPNSDCPWQKGPKFHIEETTRRVGILETESKSFKRKQNIRKYQKCQWYMWKLNKLKEHRSSNIPDWQPDKWE